MKRLIRKGAPVGLALLTQVQEVDSSSKLELKPQEPWVRQLLDEYDDVFRDPLPPGLPPDRGVGHSTPTEPGHTPPFKPMYRLSPLELWKAQAQISKFLADGIIEPSKSPYGSPILFFP